MTSFMERANTRKVPKESKEKSGCEVEVKKTKTGKKILVGKGCTREQMQMIKESGQLSFDE